jgi:hypothetical protein
MSAGIAIAATLISILVPYERPIVTGDFVPIFVIFGVIVLLSIWGFTRLRLSDGMEITGHRQTKPADAIVEQA